MRKLGAALSAFALAVTLGACGEQGGGDEAASNNSGGNEQAATNLAALAQSIGDSTEQTNTAHLEMTADAAGMKLTGEGDLEVGADQASMDMTMSTPSGEMSVVFTDGVLYVRTPQEVEPGKSWLRIDQEGDDPLSKALATMTEQMRQNADPRRTLEQFQDAGTITAQEEGVEVNGERTTHYRIIVDVQKVAEQQQDPMVRKALRQAGLKDFPIELWVDEEDLPVRMKVDMPLADPASGKAAKASIQLDYTDWGEPVEITAPPAGQVAELPAR
ncbi:LppX_LprAFG lipoprotein [Actinophytocola gossypii]|uniref:LppX_LprAFG lipoprotein n=1 Tax=Actinophytocola gossypii TaxID=2812003 RepID=A0ABT2JFR5_9PSEU|nr:LppX_LprAFG lipoprotein [Actinophytocola gossypii]MCT2586270.1 LppX_LprAFG lipoprotein [Actinophytocola gossypii]